MTEIKIPPTHLNIARSLMPQIKSDDVKEFLENLSHQGIKIWKTKVVANTLKPTQNEFNHEKIMAMMKKDLSKTKPVLISRDGYILDGHHRAIAEFNRNTKSKVDAIVIGLNIMDLIQKAREFDKVFYKAVHENTIKTIKRVIHESLK